MKELAILLALLGQTIPIEEIYDHAEKAETYWYSRDTLPRVYTFMVFGDRIYKQGVDVGPKGGRNEQERAGSPINMFPWEVTGGMDQVDRSRTSEWRYMWVPPGEHIEIWKERAKSGNNQTPHYRIAGRFPVGTMFAEYLYHEDEIFEVRCRRKDAEGIWITASYKVGVSPPGFNRELNCQECHRDAGKTAAQIDFEDGRKGADWYGNVSGLEPGGPLHWHPFRVKGISSRQNNTGYPIRIREDVKHLVRWR
jgi:hypothetical protein